MRVVVTGLGMISPLGGDLPSSMRRLFAGERGVRPLELFSLPGARSQLAAQVVDLEPQALIAARTDAMAVQAAREALAHAKLDPHTTPIHLVVGGTTAGMFETEELLTQLDGVDITEDLGVRLRTHPLSSTADRLCEHAGPFASARTMCCACTSGVAALALAYSWIRTGRAEVALAGGADALCRLTYSGFGCLAVLDANPCRPFGKGRGGLNLGEGAGFLVLESDRSARARGAEVLAEIGAVALAGEAHHITNPEPTGKTAARVISTAIARAGLTPADIDYVNAHGTATPHNDAAESAGIRTAFGDARPRVSSSKGQIGHTLGAAGALEAVICVEAIRTRRLPPTIGTGEIDPAIDIDHVFETTAVAKPFIAISNSFGFGGTGGTVVILPPNTQAELPARSDKVVVTGAATIVNGSLIEGENIASLLVLREQRDVGDVVVRPSDPTASLDAARTRRMDRAGKLSAAVVGGALRDADRDANPIDRTDVAAISGTAFGNVDGSVKFMKRVLEKGAALASPADFPNLVPSSPVSHAAIYWGLGGPALATPDLSVTAESAAATGMELVESGVCMGAIVGSVEEVSKLAERVLAPLLGVRTLAAQSEGASALALESAACAAARGKKALCSVLEWTSARGNPSIVTEPNGRSWVVSEPAVDVDALLGAESPWRGVARWTTSAEAGEHVGLGGVALAAAAAAIASERADRILVLGQAPDRSYAFVFERAP